MMVCAGALTGCSPWPATPLRAEALERSPFFLRCGSVGEACCRAPAASQVPSLGPLVACNVGLGCDIQTNTCVQPCGGTGQVCCDGPETRAPKWTADGKPYSPNTWDMQEMCKAGACERQSHRCFACGTVDGQPCCPPDAAQATARCIGERLSCEFDPQRPYSIAGVCIKCGIAGRPPCDWGCDPGLGMLNKLCAACGGDGQVPCDGGLCKPGLGKIGGVCRTCGGLNQIPCDTGCSGGLGVRQGVCAACGNIGQPPCDNGCKTGARAINGICQPCGGLNQVPCDKGAACNYPYRVAGGVCKQCGQLGQIPCDVGCDGGLVIINNQCSKPATSDPPTCAKVGEACVGNFVPSGNKCCNPPATPNPLVCSYNTCKVCVPRGQQCVRFGPHLCCDKDDQCILDVQTQRDVCGIPG